MTRIELTSFIHANFETADISTVIIDLTVNSVLDGHDLTDITTCDLIEICDNELFIHLYASNNQINYPERD